MESFKVAFCTCDNLSTAKKLAELVVRQKLAACVNIVPNIYSVYSWNEKVEQSEEVLMILKTRSELIEALKDTIVSNHPYEVPEFITLDITHGHEPYLNWLAASTTSKG